MSKRLEEVEPVVVEADVFRRIWFESGGNDLWGDATDEELVTAHWALEDQEERRFLGHDDIHN
jgi:hypothetical protein